MGLKVFINRILKHVVHHRKVVVHHGKKIVHHAKRVHHHVKRVAHHGKNLAHHHRHMLLSFSHIGLLFALLGFFHLNGVMFANEVVLDDATVVVEEQTVVDEMGDVVQEEIIIEEVVEEIVEEIIEEESIVDVVEENSEINTGDIQTETGEVLTGFIVTGDVVEDTGFVFVGALGEVAPPTENIEIQEIEEEILIVETGSVVSGTILTGEILTGEILTGEILTGDVLETTGLIITGDIRPDHIDGLMAWFDAAIPGSMTFSGNQVLNWQDRRGGFYKSFMNDLDRAPSLVQNVVSGRPALFFDDINDGMETNISMGDEYTIFLIYNKQKTSIDTTRVIQGFNNWYLGSFDNKVMHYASGEVSNVYDNSNTQFKIVSVTHDLSQVDFFVGRNDFTQNNTYTESPDVLGFGTVGGSDQYPIAGYIAEIIVFDHALDSAYREKITEYLEDKYYDLNSYGGRPTVVVDTEKEVVEEIIEEEIIEEIVVDTGSILTGEIFTGEVLTGEVIVETGIVLTGEILTGEILTGEVFTGDVFAGEDFVETGIVEFVCEENYFDRVFEKNEVSDSVISLQELLTYLGFYAGDLDGKFDQQMLNAVYGYQLGRGILTKKDNKKLAGYMGPSTRDALNAEWCEYQESLNGNVFMGEVEMTGEYLSALEIKQQRVLDRLTILGYKKGIKTLRKVDAESLIGNQIIAFSEFSGQLLLPVVLQSTNQMSGMSAEVEIPEGALLTVDGGGEFTGDLMPPVFLDTGTLNILSDEKIVSAIDVGSDQHIGFKNISGNNLNAIFTIPAPGLMIGDSVSINYSEDGQSWSYLDTINVIDIDGSPYVIFEANHFTIFYLGVQSSDFVINNDANYTTSLSVVLHNYASTATQIRFGNSVAERDAAVWEPYTITKAWNLSVGTGIKTVYAEFDNGHTIISVQDTITYLETLIVSNSVFSETFSPANYYSNNWGRQGSDRDSVNGSSCYGGVGDCAHVDGISNEGSDWILTNAGLIDLSDAVSATIQVKVREDRSFDNNDYFRVWCKNIAGDDVKIYEENGGNWSTNTTWHTREAIVDPSCLIADARFKITQIANNKNEDLYIDDFMIIKNTELSNAGGIFASIEYAPAFGVLTSGSVVATLTGLSSSGIVVTNNGGLENYVFTGNGSFVFDIEDGGVTGEVTATVDWIDNEAPIFAGVSSGMIYTGVLSGGLYISNTAISFSDDNLSGATLNGIPYISGQIITGEGNYVFVVSDLAGNVTGATFTIQLQTEEKIHNYLISTGYVIGNTSLVDLGEDYYIGNENIDMSSFDGDLLLPTVLQSSNHLGGNISEVEIPAGAKLKKIGGSSFTGLLNAPAFQTASTYDIAIGATAISAVDVGGINHIFFKDTGNNKLDITYRMPVPGKNVGDLVDVYSSEDGNSFVYLTTVSVQNILGDPYVVFATDHMSVLVTASSNGTNISADLASNSLAGAAYTTLSNIVIAEQVKTDFAANQNNTTVILTAPTNWSFNPGVGNVSYTNNRDIDAASVAVTASTITVTLTTDANANKVDTLTIAGIQVQAITGNILPSAGNIVRTSGNPGTASVVGITNDVTNFGSLSQTFGDHANLVVTLSGQTFVAGSGNTGNPFDQEVDENFVIPVITATDQFNNIVDTYAGAKTLSYTGPVGTGIYTTSVSFASGQSTTVLNTILEEEQTGATISVDDGTVSGPSSSAFDVIFVPEPLASLSYAPGVWYENQAINNGSISGNIVVTLSTGSFSGGVSDLISLTNVPTGLTGVFALSGTNQVVVSLSGTATSHASTNSVFNITMEFLTGSFVDMNPNEVTNYKNTALQIVFYDPNPITGILPIDDTMIDADTDPGGVGDCADGKCQRNNYGATDYLCASDFGSKVMFRFDLSSLPAGATITSASIRLNRYHIPGGTDSTGFTLKQIINNSGWIEGTRDTQEALVGEPNYIQRARGQDDWYNGSPGMQAGLDYANTNLITIGGFTGGNTSTYNQTFAFNTAGIDLVQSWAMGLDNQGIVMGDIPTSTEHRLCTRSKEYAVAADRPSLIVNYYIDYNDPIISSLSPLDNATGVTLNSSLFMNFNEKVFATSGKFISIKKLSDDSLVELINVGNESIVTITNSQVKINPTSDFENNTGYYIEVESGAFMDKGMNAFAGFTGSTTWNFETADTSFLPSLTGTYATGVYANTGIFGTTVSSTGGDVITERGFCWSTVHGFNDCGPNKVSEVGSWNTTGEFTLPVMGLPAGTTVYVKSMAVNSYGTNYSDEISFVTRPDTVTLDLATKIDNNKFNMHRNIVTGADSYNLYVSTDSGFATYITGYAPLTGLTGTEFVVTGLERTTEYFYKMTATNSAGDSVDSLTNSTTTTFYPTPIAWLKFEETAGTIAYDSAEGAFHDGILFGNPIKQQTGVDGNSFYYDGIDDNVSIVNFDYGDQYTIGFWFNTTSTGDNMHMFSHGGDNDTSSINVVLDNATQTLSTYVNGNQTLFVLGSGIYNQLIDGDWHYYTISVDNDGAVPGKYEVVVYVDGVYELIDSSLDTSVYAPTNNLVLGRISNTTANYYDGYIDDFRIFDQVLTTGEVWDLYNQLEPGVAGTLSIVAPVEFDFGVRDASEYEQQIEVGFTGANDAFKIVDDLGTDLGYYSTLAISDFTSASGDVIASENISIKALTGLVVFSGDVNPNIELTLSGNYQTMGTGALMFIKRDTGANGNLKGTYGTEVGFEVNIPALQNIGDYTGTITFTLYDN